MRVLFVCMGNICRSPAAEIIFRKMVNDADLAGRIEIDSAGTTGYHQGSAPDRRIAEALATRGYVAEGRARQLGDSDLSGFDLILTMDEENRAMVLLLDGNGEHRHKIRRFVEYLVESEAEGIPDPYYGGKQGFDEVIALLEEGCANLLREIGETLP